MRLVHTSLAVAIAAALVAGATASAGSGEATAQRQRVAINMVVNNETDTAIFTLSRLPSQAHPPMDVPGVRLDEGTVAMGGGGMGHPQSQRHEGDGARASAEASTASTARWNSCSAST